MEAYKRKLEYRERIEVQNAYLSAYWQRVKKMPKLSEVLENKEKEEMTDEQMLSVVKQLNAKFGGEVVG